MISLIEYEPGASNPGKPSDKFILQGSLALSIRQPWAWAIFNAGKNVENRTWCPRFYGPLVIHASKKTPVEEYIAAEDFILSTFDIEVPELPASMFGALLGVVHFRGAAWSNSWDGAWGMPHHYHWQLRNPRRFVKPVPYKGQLGLFTVRFDKKK